VVFLAILGKAQNVVFGDGVSVFAHALTVGATDVTSGVT